MGLSEVTSPTHTSTHTHTHMYMCTVKLTVKHTHTPKHTSHKFTNMHNFSCTPSLTLTLTIIPSWERISVEPNRLSTISYLVLLPRPCTVMSSLTRVLRLKGRNSVYGSQLKIYSLFNFSQEDGIIYMLSPQIKHLYRWAFAYRAFPYYLKQ